jgi:hypothetical protein
MMMLMILTPHHRPQRHLGGGLRMSWQHIIFLLETIVTI